MEVELIEAFLEVMVPAGSNKRLDKSVQRLMKLEDNPILASMVLFVTEHLGELNIDLIFEGRLNKGV
jgi:hypothetical protein